MKSLEGPVTAGSVPNPLAGLAAPPLGPARGSVNCSGNSVQTIQPGAYGSLNASGNCQLTLMPGAYTVTSGGFKVSGNAVVHGAEVLIYVVGGQINLSGNGALNLTPPAAGPYAGLVLVQDAANTSAISFSGNATLFDGVQGTLYAPSAQATLSGNGQVRLALIVDRLRVDGNAQSTLMAAGRGSLADDTATILGAGQLTTGVLWVAMEDDSGDVAAEYLARFRDVWPP